MKALKILGVVFGVLLLLAGGGLLAGSALVGQGQGAFDQELAKSGLAGPVSGTVLSIDQGAIYTVSYRRPARPAADRRRADCQRHRCAGGRGDGRASSTTPTTPARS